MSNSEKFKIDRAGDQFKESASAEKLEELHLFSKECLKYSRQELTDLLETKQAVFSSNQPNQSGQRELSDSSRIEYDDSQIIDGLSTRRRGTLAYHQEVVKYDDKEEDDEVTLLAKQTYRLKLLETGQKLGFLDEKIKQPTNSLEEILDCSSEPEKITEELEAIVVPTAAGLSNIKRAYHVFKAIATGAIVTDKIVFASCDRPTSETEKKSLTARGFSSGETEYQLVIGAINDIFGGFVGETQPIQDSVVFRDSETVYPITGITGQVDINGRLVTVKVVDSPFDKSRVMADGTLATRANTEETYYSVATVLDNSAKKPVCITSHDIWQLHQLVVAERVFGVNLGRNVFSSAPNNCSRLYIDANGQTDIASAEALEDEMSKYLYELEKLERAVYIKQMTTWLVEFGQQQGYDFSSFETTSLNSADVSGGILSYLYQANASDIIISNFKAKFFVE